MKLNQRGFTLKPQIVITTSKYLISKKYTTKQYLRHFEIIVSSLNFDTSRLSLQVDNMSIIKFLMGRLQK